MAFHETFWAVTGTAAPVIALAAVVSMTEIAREAFRVGAAWDSQSRQRWRAVDASDEDAENVDWGNLTNEQIDELAAQRAAAAERAARGREITLAEVRRVREKASAAYEKAMALASLGNEIFDEMQRAMKTLRTLNLDYRVQQLNVGMQALLLAASLLSIAYQRNLIAPLIAVAVTVLGVLILGMVGANVVDAKKTTRFFQKSELKTRQSLNTDAGTAPVSN